VISVLSPTIRGLQALRPIEQSLNAQSFTDWEWLVEFGNGREHSLNRDFNSMLRRARGELVVFAEDWVWFPLDGLERFWDAYRAMPQCFFTAPVPKSPAFWEMDGNLFYKHPLELEWRSENPGWVHWMNWEADWAAAPLGVLKSIGGFDERMDQKWSNDNQNVSFRAFRAGCKFWNVIDNPAVALSHDKYWKHPFRHLHDAEWSERQIKRFENEQLPPLT
jgi:hypothetical protein